MKTQMTAFLIMLALSFHATANDDIEADDCRTFANLSKTFAVLRDQGITQSESMKIINDFSGNKLTSSDLSSVNVFATIVYGESASKIGPDTIETMILRKCLTEIEG